MARKKNSKAALKKKAKGKKTKQAKQTKQNKQNKQQTKAVPKDDLSTLFHTEKEFNRDITINKLTVAPINGGANLIEECDLKLTHGHRYGLIGYNGAGKSTLLRQLASDIYKGKEIPSYLNVLHTHQELKGDQLTVIQTVLKSDKKREFLLKKESDLKKEMESFADDENNKNNEQKRNIEDIVNELEDIQTKMKFIEADTAEARASALLNGLCFTNKMKNMKTKDLSGGWRMRVSLASALFIEPDLLLLDEPTNHLDFPSVLWLAEYLQFNYSLEKTIVIVSHDRRFLNDICTNIIHLNKKKLTFYTGNYDSFIKIRSEMRIHQNKQYEKQQAVIAHNKEFIAKFAANKKWSTQAQSRQKLLDKLVLIEKVTDDLSFGFEFPKPNPLRNPSIFRFEDVTFGYFGEEKPDTFILKDINIRFNYGQKVGILGANGAGKSTLIKLIMDKVKPLFGSSHLSNAVQIGYFSQHHIDNLDLNLTPLKQLEKEFGSKNVTRQQLYAQLGRFGLAQHLVERKIGTLSGGQKSRVTFAILTWYSPHLIIMDEPTNHLDIPTIDGLANALSQFDGSVLIVSHDQHFVEKSCDEFWCVGNRKIKVFQNFKKCIKYSKTCKAPNNLPREYENKNMNNIKKERTKEKSKKIKKVIDSAVFEVDAEREIEKGLKKGLTPNAILRHCKGWKAVDGNNMIVNKLGFVMFNKYFDLKEDDDIDIDHFEFFKDWKKLINYCIPLNHTNNQYELFNIAVKSFITAYKDKSIKAIKSSYSFGFILESMVIKHSMINLESIQNWLTQNQDKTNNIAISQIRTFIEIVNDDDDDDSDSDSD